MRQYDRELLVATTVVDDHGAAPGQAWQAVAVHRMWLQPAEKSVAVLPQVTDIAVDLLVPVVEVRVMCQVCSLIDKGGAQAPGIDLLQTDHVVVGDQLGDAIQVLFFDGMREEVLPALRDVVTMLGCLHPGLDVVTQQPETISGCEFSCGRFGHLFDRYSYQSYCAAGAGAGATGAGAVG